MEFVTLWLNGCHVTLTSLRVRLSPTSCRAIAPRRFPSRFSRGFLPFLYTLTPDCLVSRLSDFSASISPNFKPTFDTSVVSCWLASSIIASKISVAWARLIQFQVTQALVIARHIDSSDCLFSCIREVLPGRGVISQRLVGQANIIVDLDLLLPIRELPASSSGIWASRKHASALSGRYRSSAFAQH